MTLVTMMFGVENIIPKSVVNNLGAYFDSTLMMEHQVQAVTRSMYYNIRPVAKVKPHLTSEACAKAINATVLSHLDYQNGVLVGASDTTIRKLQVAQNSAA